ncbi:hypothetical protein LAB1_56270 [Roseibium sp. LAB1]
MVKVHYIEGVATHSGPESCGYDREVMREALTGGSAGQPLSRENSFSWVPTLSGLAEGNMERRVNSERFIRPNVVSRPWHAWMISTREPGDLEPGQSPLRVAGPHWEGEEP